MKKRNRIMSEAIATGLIVTAIIINGRAVAMDCELPQDDVVVPSAQTCLLQATQIITASDEMVSDEIPESAEPTPTKKLENEEDYEATPPVSDDVPLSDELQISAQKWCDEYGVPYALVLAVIEKESTFKADAKSGSCRGYMQISSINLSDLNEAIGITDLSDPAQNIQAGTYMLGDLYKRYGDWSKALICYNAGEGAAYSGWFSKGYTSSSYSRAVLELQAKWEAVLAA